MNLSPQVIMHEILVFCELMVACKLLQMDPPTSMFGERSFSVKKVE